MLALTTAAATPILSVLRPAWVIFDDPAMKLESVEKFHPALVLTVLRPTINILHAVPTVVESVEKPAITVGEEIAPTASVLIVPRSVVSATVWKLLAATIL